MDTSNPFAILNAGGTTSALGDNSKGARAVASANARKKKKKKRKKTGNGPPSSGELVGDDGDSAGRLDDEFECGENDPMEGSALLQSASSVAALAEEDGWGPIPAEWLKPQEEWVKTGKKKGGNKGRRADDDPSSAQTQQSYSSSYTTPTVANPAAVSSFQPPLSSSPALPSNLTKAQRRNLLRRQRKREEKSSTATSTLSSSTSIESASSYISSSSPSSPSPSPVASTPADAPVASASRHVASSSATTAKKPLLDRPAVQGTSVGRGKRPFTATRPPSLTPTAASLPSAASSSDQIRSAGGASTIPKRRGWGEVPQVRTSPLTQIVAEQKTGVEPSTPSASASTNISQEHSASSASKAKAHSSLSSPSSAPSTRILDSVKPTVTPTPNSSPATHVSSPSPSASDSASGQTDPSAFERMFGSWSLQNQNDPSPPSSSNSNRTTTSAVSQQQQQQQQQQLQQQQQQLSHAAASSGTNSHLDAAPFSPFLSPAPLRSLSFPDSAMEATPAGDEGSEEHPYPERQSSPAYNHFTSGPSLLFHPQQSPGVGLGLGGLGGYGNANGAGVTQQPFYGADKQAVYEGMQEAAAAAGVEQYGFSHPSMGYQQFGDYGMQEQMPSYGAFNPQQMYYDQQQQAVGRGGFYSSFGSNSNSKGYSSGSPQGSSSPRSSSNAAAESSQQTEEVSIHPPHRYVDQQRQGPVYQR